MNRKNVWDAISRSNSIYPENILFWTRHNVLYDSNIKMRQRQEGQISNSLTRQIMTSHLHHTFLYISLPSTAQLPLKTPNFMFCEGHKEAMTRFILFINFDMLTKIQLQKSSLALTK